MGGSGTNGGAIRSPSVSTVNFPPLWEKTARGSAADSKLAEWLSCFPIKIWTEVGGIEPHKSALNCFGGKEMTLNRTDGMLILAIRATIPGFNTKTRTDLRALKFRTIHFKLYGQTGQSAIVSAASWVVKVETRGFPISKLPSVAFFQ